jgi:hypothetical protein
MPQHDKQPEPASIEPRSFKRGNTVIKFDWKDILFGHLVELRTQTYCEHAPGNTANGETHAEANTAVSRDDA